MIHPLFLRYHIGCGARPHDGDRDSAGSRHGEWDSQICEDKRDEEGRLGRRQEKEEFKEDIIASSSNSNSNLVHSCMHGDRSGNKLF